MSKTLVLSPAVVLTIVLSVVPAAASMVWWMSDLSTRLGVMEDSVESFETTDTSILQERLAALEAQTVVLNNVIEKLDGKIDDVENSVSVWAEKEFQKVYDIINKGNPLGQ